VIVLDATEGRTDRPRGWSRYVVELARALEPWEDVVAVAGRGRGPEVLWEQAGLPRALRRRGASLVHAPNCFLPLRRPCPGVVTVHDLAFEAFPGDFAPRTRWKYARLGRAAARSAERVIVPSRATAEDVERRWGVAPERLRVVPEAPALPLGTARDPASPGGAPRDPYVLAIGDLRAKKDLATAVEATRRLGVRLLLAGVDAGEGARLGAAPHVEVLGWVDDARLDALLRGAAALVHPSLYEGFGLVVLEAMARGVPVACADATSLPEVAGGAAALFPPGDPAGAAEALAAVLGPDRERFAAQGRARAEAFSWERTARETRAVYEELL
jgi:glycosyltransferase involved in cell wall biosynthesis